MLMVLSSNPGSDNDFVRVVSLFSFSQDVCVDNTSGFDLEFDRSSEVEGEVKAVLQSCTSSQTNYHWVDVLKESSLRSWQQYRSKR